ncbi:unannotated protein [freshwater metagenome]|uniref:Unannotated protein n=1 Tax=freshwater metagenome TaxID=449393 RepID=A0A6J6H1I6_9ZZZZ
MAFGMGGDADGEIPFGCDQLDEFRGEFEFALDHVTGIVDDRIAGQRQDVRYAGGLVLVEQRIDLVAGVADAGEMGHRRDADVLFDVDHHVAGALTGGTTGAIGDRHERRIERSEIGDGLLERACGLVGLRREELERTGASGSEKVGDAGHRGKATRVALRHRPC